MIAKEGYIVRLLDGTDKKFIVPVYQRPYSWKKSDCELLFQDLITAYEKGYVSHFFGSIVYVENDIGGCNEYVIIDGQQRLTTVSLLLLAIRNFLVENNLTIEGINQTKITKAYLTDEYAADAKKLKLKLVQGDDDAYDRLIERGEPIKDNRVTLNYNYFSEEIEQLNDVELKGLYDAVTKLAIVNISLKPSDGDDPQLIFESLNSTGRDLEESDKIRNYVLMRLDSKRQEKVYKNYWEKLETKVGKDELTSFIRYYLSVKTRELSPEGRLYFAFKVYREKNNSLDIENILGDLLIYADYYQKIKNAQTGIGYFGVIARINKLEVNTVIPLLFDLFTAIDNKLLSENEMKIAVETIETFLVRRLICGLPTSPLNKLFVYTGDEIEKYNKKASTAAYLDIFTYALLSKTGKSRFPNDHDFYEKFLSFELYNVKPSARKYILERLENAHSKERVAVEDQLANNELSIEHIMPQNLTQEWKEYLGTNWELIHTKYLHTIGNLTLTAYNSDYSNLMFDKKINMSGKGIAASKLSLNEYIKKCSQWTEREIKERASALLVWAKGLWPIPITIFRPNIDEEWMTIDDDIDFTNKSISKMVFLSDEFVTDNITDAYRKICAQFYTIDPILFSKLNHRYYSTDVSTLRSPYELQTSMFIETNLSSQAKIALIRELMVIFGLEISEELKFLVHTKQKNKVPFNIKKESTYDSITAGNLAYAILKKLLTEHKLTANEISALMTKDFCSTHFYRVSYPALALSIDANRGRSTKNRYYKDPVVIDNVSYFISSQWFDDSRDNLIEWYKEHLS